MHTCMYHCDEGREGCSTHLEEQPALSVSVSVSVSGA